MSATFRHGLERLQPRAEAPAAGAGRLAWFGGLGALIALCLATALLLPQMETPERAPPSTAEALSLLGARPPEPATLSGLSRALGVLERDLGTWQGLVAPEGRVDLGALRDRAGQLTAPRPAAAAAEYRAEPQPDPRMESRAEPRAEPGANPGQVALVALAVTLALATLLAGLAALLLERLLLAPYRSLRGVAAAMAEGRLDMVVPGTCRDDEAGALARALERVRLAALAANGELHLESMTLEEAGDRMLAAAGDIERIAATAAARGLEASLAGRQSDEGRMQVAEGARELAQQVVAIRDATDAASAALARMAQGVAGFNAPPAGAQRARQSVMAD